MTAHPDIDNDSYVKETIQLVETFYRDNPPIKESHGLVHVMAVYQHALKAVQCCEKATPKEAREILIAALLHDVDDAKYFAHEGNLNATEILSKVGVTYQAAERILAMIDWVSCSKNGNDVPDFVLQNEKYHLLIPRWSDRLEAVGKQGVLRCYQYAKEHNQALSGEKSPRPTSAEEIWQFATLQRFRDYQTRKKSGDADVDMISHF